MPSSLIPQSEEDRSSFCWQEPSWLNLRMGCDGNEGRSSASHSASFSSNSRSLKFSKKYPQETRKRRDFIMSTPSISGLTIFIVILNLEDILRNFLVLLFPDHIMSL